MSLPQRIRRFGYVAAVLVIGCLGAATLSAARGGPGFDLGTVAKKYHFSFTGRGGDGNNYAAVGWFQVSDAGGFTLTGGHIEIAYVTGGSSTIMPDSLDLKPSESIISVRDTTNGIYNLDIAFQSGVRGAFFGTKIILCDAHGNAGRMSGGLVYSPGEGQGPSVGGVGLGEIIAP